MSSLDPYKSSKISDRTGCADLAKMAERKLSAFFRAVAESFGPEQAKLSAADWLQELREMDDLPASAREWQRFIAKVSSRLANRVNASSLSIRNA